MDFLINTLYLFGVVFFGSYLYYWCGLFKKMGTVSQRELNEFAESEEELVSKSESHQVNFIGTILFLSCSVLIWFVISVVVGRIASTIQFHWSIQWLVYFLIYFFFLKTPFSIATKSSNKSLELENLTHTFLLAKIIIIGTIILSYILTICCFESFPSYLTWFVPF